MRGWARRPLLRRLVTVPAIPLVTLLVVVLLPLTLLLSALLDVVAGPRWHWRRVRLLLLVTGLLVTETVSLGIVLYAWIRCGFGRTLHSRRTVERHHALERWWTARHRILLRVLGGMHFTVYGEELIHPGPIIAIGRHTSHVDAALPAWLLAGDHGLRLRYVLKDDLQWSPCMDIVGNWLPNHFVDRDPADPAGELDTVRSLVVGLGPNEAAVIFPEGTFPTADRRRRAVERIRSQDPDRAARVEDLQVLLPPRPGGTIALLEGAPAADILLIAHVGFEQLSTISQIIRGLPFPAPVEVQLWRIPRAEVPTDPQDRVRWLDEQWRRLDDWVAARLSPATDDTTGRPSGAGDPTPGGNR